MASAVAAAAWEVKMASFRSRTLTEYAQIIWRRRLLIFLIATGMLISSFLVIDRLPNVYESQASVVVASPQGDRPTINSQVNATTERLTSRAFLEPIIQQQNPYGTGGNLDAAIARLRQDTKVDTTYRSDFPERITIAYRHSDPAVAKAVLTDLISVFGNMNRAMEKQLADQASSLASEINSIENRLRDMGKLRAALATRRSFSGRAAGEINAMRAQRMAAATAAASSIETLTDKQFSLEQQIAEQQRQIAEQQKIVKQAPSDAHASGSYGVLLVRKAELEAQLNDYSTQYTDKNPKVIQARNQLAEINHQMAQLNAGGEAGGPVNSAEARELRAMQRELVRMQTELAVTKRELDRKQHAVPNAASVASVVSTPAPAPVAVSTGDEETPVQADYETLRKRYDVLLNRQAQLERAQVSTAGLDPGVFQIVDQPAEPRVPVGPNRLKYKMFALALSLGVALLVAIAIEFPKLYAIRDDRDVEYYLGVRVIALIPETATPTTPQPRRLLPGRATGALPLLIAVVLVSIILLLSYSKVFSTLLR